jgi:hypothetical protein
MPIKNRRKLFKQSYSFDLMENHTNMLISLKTSGDIGNFYE